MRERTNQEWLAALSEPGPEREAALTDLRTFLVRGLGYAMADRPQVSEADIEGFAQDALLKILDNLASFRGESRFTTWAQKIAVHEAFTDLRRKRWENVSLEEMIARYEGDFTPDVLTDPEPSPEERVTQQRLLELVKRLIAEELTDRQRQALIAVIFAGMPTEQVARRMGTSRNALYKLMHDARQRLKRRLQAEGISLEDALAAFETSPGKRSSAQHV
jgi:RNA polymerase sigma-70 factor (ECF subfamily)